MSESRSDKLIRELLALYAKYGGICFEEALAKIESGTTSELISRLGRASAKTLDRERTAQGAQRPGASRANKAAKFVASLEYSSDAKKRFIGEFSRRILTKSVLASGRSLAAFASRLGVDVGQKIDRGTLILRIGTKLLDLDSNSVREAVEFGDRIDNQKSSLQEWSNIIVKDRNN